MLRPRIIPSLLIKNGGLVKTVKFSNPKYVGDPINAVRIFNEKEVDELAVFDIDATKDGREPDYKIIEHLAAECRMPLCYGGGVKTTEQARRIFGLGVEKISISSAAIDNPKIVSQIAEVVGCQSVVVVLDAKKTNGKYELLKNNGEIATGIDPAIFAKQMQELGAGEIIINSIDHDGMMNGYDLQLVEKVRDFISLPMTILGGAGKLQHIGDLIKKFGVIGASAGSLFVFKGPYKAVLINYPNRNEKDSLVENNFSTNS